ncbi:hypothetical protein [Leptotrichia sp. oral taxon 215]|uniref:hypothetical protein n=1 Tax=Leptotrichia sp. oral taxon 215 TaxID=712359 RepID=UPI001E552CB6|nr:hypothetical protein [Leptotrichia sp. oral taxon 215]
MKSRKLMMFLLAVVMLLVTACGPGEKKVLRVGKKVWMLQSLQLKRQIMHLQ